jgi:hypothetical protein
VFNALFEKAPEGTFVEITSIGNGSGNGNGNGNGNGEIHRTFINPRDVELVTQSLVDKSVEDTFFGVALRNKAGSTKEDVYGTRAFWVDIDLKNWKPGQQLLYTFPPSLVVWSGGGWHLYWLLDDWCTSIETIEASNKALAEDTYADSCWNANRLLRIPGTRNSKYDLGSDIAELRQSRPVIYKQGDFAILQLLSDKPRHKIRTGDSRGYKSRSERDWAVIESLVIAGADDRLIRQLFITQPVGDKFRDPRTPKPEDYLAHTIEAVRDRSRNVQVVRKRGRPPGGGGSSNVIEGPDGYYLEGSKGTFRLSTFLYEPELLLELERPTGGTEDVLVGTINSNGYVWTDFRLPRSAFNDRRGLDKYLGASAHVWLGKDDHVRLLLPYLLRKLQDKGLPRSKATSVLGRHGKYFVGTGQTMDAETIWSGAEGPLVYNPTGRESPHIRFRVSTGDDLAPPLPNLTQLPLVNAPEVVLPILGWFVATPFKTEFEARNIRFPILNLYGTRGSGKTSLIRLCQRMLGYEKTAAYNITTTNYVILSILGSSNAVPVAFSEFRGSIAEKFIRFVLLAYDTGHDARGRGDQTTVDYPLSAPFSVDGEDIINDAACRERIIAVALHPETIAEGTTCYAAFNGVYAEPLENFAKPYIQHTLSYTPDMIDDLLAESRRQIVEAFPMALPDRVRNNLVVVRAGLLALSEFNNTPEYRGTFNINVRETFEPVLRSVWSPELGRGATLADEFCEAVVNSVAGASSNYSSFRTSVDTEQGVLWFQLATAFQWWLRQRNMARQTTLDREAIRTQLVERDIARGGQGQYIHKAKTIEGTWMYGIDLVAASQGGLDIPNHINWKEVTFRFPKVDQ